jgi:P4 family phage/plasmid primase-like protien
MSLEGNRELIAENIKQSHTLKKKHRPGEAGCKFCKNYVDGPVSCARDSPFMWEDFCPYYASSTPEKITDKLITDTITEKYEFYCDKSNPNAPLYLWNDGAWNNGVSENIILHAMTEIVKEEENRTLMRTARNIDFIKGISMGRVVIDKPPELINFKNGMLNIDTDELLPHDPKYFSVNQIPHEYNPDAKVDYWLEWLGEVLYSEDIAFMQEWMGYNLYEAVPEAAFTVFTGTGQNGKTCFMDLFTMLLGEENVSAESFQSLSYGPYSVIQTYHKLANISDEVGTYVIKDCSKVKSISGGSRMTERAIYGKQFPFYPYSKLSFACNTPPEIRDMSDAVKMRLKFIEFPYIFKKDPNLNEGQKQATDRKEIMMKLHDEKDGIIAWMVEGLKGLKKKNFSFTTTRSTEETWQFYNRKSKPVLMFVNEGLSITDSDSDKMTIDGMYNAFLSWLTENGIKADISRQKLIKDLKDEGITTTQRREDNKVRMYYGVTLEQEKTSSSMGKSRDSMYIESSKKTRSSVTLDEYDWDEGYPSPG